MPEERKGIESTGAEWPPVNKELPNESLLPLEVIEMRCQTCDHGASYHLGPLGCRHRDTPASPDCACEKFVAISAVDINPDPSKFNDAMDKLLDGQRFEGFIRNGVLFLIDGHNNRPVGLLERHDATSLREAASFVLQSTTGLDLESVHGKETPARFLKMLRELTTAEAFDFKTFEDPSAGDEMIVIRDITFVSVCNHHVIPFHGKAHIGYIPNDKHLIAGLSKFARLVRYHARSLQVQERLTNVIANELETRLVPKGVAVILEAEHMCMTIRGVQAPGTMTRTAAMRGVFADHGRTAKAEFLQALNGHK